MTCALPTHRISDREKDSEEAFSLVISGDVCPRLRGEEKVLAGEAGTIFQKIQPFISTADLRIVQWETPLVSQPSPIPKSGILNCNPKTAELARIAGFDLALLANNHTGDHGPDAVLETISNLTAVGVKTVGAGKYAEACAPVFFDVSTGIGRSRRLAVLNFAENEFGMATNDRPGAAPLSPIANLATARKLSRQVDWVIVVLHGGHEFNPFPSPRIQELCRAFAEAGASVVFNCHTHCPEGLEFHHGTPIVYSPGNLYFPRADGGPNRMWWSGYIPKFHFDASGCHMVELLPYCFTAEEVRPLDKTEFTGFQTYFQALCEPLANPDHLQCLFESWSSQSAQHYLSHAFSNFPEDWLERLEEPEVFGKLLVWRNQFTCESHADMARCYFRLIEEHRLDQARREYPLFFALQNPEWLNLTHFPS